jgi:hypothetical protein
MPHHFDIGSIMINISIGPLPSVSPHCPLFFIHLLVSLLFLSASPNMSYDAEKTGANHIERTPSEESNDGHIAEFTPEEQKKIIHRIDRRLVTTLGLLYMCSLMDRTNLGAANIAGFVISLTASRTSANNIFPSMAKGLKLIGNRYSLIVLIFFIPYVLFQPPATVVLRKLGPRRFLTAITLLWGGCMIVRPRL